MALLSSPFIDQHGMHNFTLAQYRSNPQNPYNGQVVFTNEWDLGSLEYSHETSEGTIFNSTFQLTSIFVVFLNERVINGRTHSRDMCLDRRTSGPSPRLSCSLVVLGCWRGNNTNLATSWSNDRIVAESNPTAIFIRNALPLLLTNFGDTSDRGKARHSVSSSSSHHHGTSSHQHDDDDDVETSHASTPSPTTYLNSLNPLNYQNYEMPFAS
ncbi:hypothetical protein Tco_0307472 [Tanacetum coccineum]